MNKLKFDPVRLRFLEKTYPLAKLDPKTHELKKGGVLEVWKLEDGRYMTEVRHD
jgi:hypothetical protein